MRHGRSIITTGLAALVTTAIAAAPAAAATLTDDSQADFAAGVTQQTTVIGGSVRLSHVVEETFDGTTLPAGWTANPPAGATVAGGQLSVDAARVDLPGPLSRPQTLEFRASFTNQPFQHIGFAQTLSGVEPWAIFSTGSNGILKARTRTNDLDELTTELPAVVGAHDFRIEWTAAAVRYLVDGVEVASHARAIDAQLRPVIADATAGSPLVVDSMILLPFVTTGTFESRVHDAGDARAVWGALTPTAVGTSVTFETRTGNTATPDASWSPYAAVGAGGAIASPPGRYIRYRATLTTADPAQTPRIDRVDLSYEVDTAAPATAIVSTQLNGTTAVIAFSSPAADVARFECSLDGGAFATCTSPASFPGLAVGGHTIAVRAVDRLGNVGGAATATVDVVKPHGDRPGKRRDRKAPHVSLSPGSPRATLRGAFDLRVRCPASERRCKVRVRLFRGDVVVAPGKRITLAGGQRATLRMRLLRPEWMRLNEEGRLRVTAAVTAKDAAGNKRLFHKRLTIRAAAQ